MDILSASAANGTEESMDHHDMFIIGRSVTCVILGLSFLVGAPGNLLVIWTILKHVQQRSHTVAVILHLAVADLLVLVTLPLWIYSLSRSWVFGEASCKAVVYVVTVCMYGSVFLITLMSAERFVAICHPFVMLRWRTKPIMGRALVVVWLLAILLAIPVIMIQRVEEEMDGTKQCLSKEYSSTSQELTFLCLEIVFGFAAPLTVLTVCYCMVAVQLRRMQNNRQKSVVLISGVVVAFVLCWLPHQIINIISLAHTLTHSSVLDDLPQGLVFVSGALAFISSSVNPALYAFAASKFQGGLRKSLLVKLFQDVSSQTDRQRGNGSNVQMSDVTEHQTSGVILKEGVP